MRGDVGSIGPIHTFSQHTKTRVTVTIYIALNYNYMKYEYHLEDDTIELSDTPNISSFPRIIECYWDEEVGDMMTEEVDMKVRYCIIKY